MGRCINSVCEPLWSVVEESCIACTGCTPWSACNYADGCATRGSRMRECADEGCIAQITESYCPIGRQVEFWNDPACDRPDDRCNTYVGDASAPSGGVYPLLPGFACCDRDASCTCLNYDLWTYTDAVCGACLDDPLDFRVDCGGWRCYKLTKDPVPMRSDQCSSLCTGGCEESTGLCLGGSCDLADNPCPTQQCTPNCGGGELCWGESCFDKCTTNPDCPETCFGFAGDPEYNRCVVNEEPCNGVSCGAQLCYGGSCFDSCGDDGDCTPPNACFDGRCADQPCAFVQCPVDDVCYGGSCFDTCSDNGDCTPPSVCYNGRCAESACDGVQCSSQEACHGGTCFVSCSDDGPCTPPETCYDSRCTRNPCAGIQCAGDEQCHQGNCILSCTEDANCNPNHHCFLGLCTQDSCTSPTQIVCAAGEVCHQGTCFTSCANDRDCVQPNACFDERCAPNSCAAKLDDHNENHLYRAMGGRWLSAAQRSSPWLIPRPIELDGSLADMSATIQARLASIIPSLPKGRARVILFAHRGTGPANARYAIVLIHGKDSSDQGAAGATYSIRYSQGTSAPTVRTQGTVTQVLTTGDFNHHQVQIETSAALGKIGGVSLVSMPASSGWDIYLNAAFRGDITRWEIYSAETNRWLELDMSEELMLRNAPIGLDITIARELGVASCQPSGRGAGRFGICSRGSITNCKNGYLICDQTVFPWSYEVCDNKDNNCDGRVDEASAMRFPMVHLRSSGEAVWRTWPTVDQNQSAAAFIQYTPHAGEPWEGSTDAKRLEDPAQSLQIHDHSLLLFHRDLRRGVISMPMLHSARTSGVEVAGAPGSAKIEAQFEFDNNNSDLMFVSWYDDWAPTSVTTVRDSVPKTVKYDEYKLEWNVRNWVGAAAVPQRESDSAIIQHVWTHGGSLQPLRYDIDMNFPGSINKWRLYTPYSDLHVLDSGAKLGVRIEHVTASNSMCLSTTATTDGCRTTQYVCQAGGVTVCPVPTAASCEGCRDLDGDTFDGHHPITCPTGRDCDDNDPNVKPGAVEVCSGADTNCDGVVDGLAAPLCPDGQASCGPQECEYRNACSCPDGPSSCHCSSALMEN
ncbi:MAG: putative metal-binding motif-containing protein [Bradymonadaceae bacterium]|nr:putative metal-binding motif-containing protein [Lujinxingiaceae bacterium]